jgi:hypothetical protein
MVQGTVHEPLIDTEAFEQVQALQRARGSSDERSKNKVSHPTSVYLREEQLLPEIDAWLSRKFDPVAFTSAVREFEAAHPGEPEPDEGAQQEIAECDAKLRQHRRARSGSRSGARHQLDERDPGQACSGSSTAQEASATPAHDG